LEDDQIIGHADRLAGIPGVPVHGRLDFGGPAEVPWTLARAWPDAALAFVDARHGGSIETVERIVAATNRFAENG
jgi:proline iminopeptidase